MDAALPTALSEDEGELERIGDRPPVRGEGEVSTDPIGAPPAARAGRVEEAPLDGVARSSSVSIMAGPTLATPTVTELEPTQEELRISARLLLHIARQPRPAPRETAPEALTQAGMAAALRTSQSAVSNALHRLVDGGALEVERSHVRRKMQRLKVYRLTSHGELLVRQILESMSR